MNTTVDMRAADAARDDLKLDGWLQFKGSLADERTIRHLLNLGADPFMRAVLTGGALGQILSEWLLYDVLPEIMATGSYVAQEDDWTFQVARCLLSARSADLPSLGEMH